jgi:hypothetical protein
VSFSWLIFGHRRWTGDRIGFEARLLAGPIGGVTVDRWPIRCERSRNIGARDHRESEHVGSSSVGDSRGSMVGCNISVNPRGITWQNGDPIDYTDFQLSEGRQVKELLEMVAHQNYRRLWTLGPVSSSGPITGARRGERATRAPNPSFRNARQRVGGLIVQAAGRSVGGGTHIQ